MAAAAVTAGLLVCAALPPIGFWPLAPIGLGAYAQLLRHADARQRMWRSVGFALGWFVPSTAWIAAFSPPGLVGTVVVFAALYAVMGLVIGGGADRYLRLPAALTVLEWFRWHAPFGGVPISSLSLTQARSPLLGTARVGGALLVTFLCALVGVALAAIGERWFAQQPRRWANVRGPLIALGCAVAVSVAAPWAPRAHTTGTMRVAVVQGGGPQGTLAINTTTAEPFDAVMTATRSIDRPVDAVIWPENVVSVDAPFQDHPWYEMIQDEARRLDAPIEAGVVERLDETSFTNYSLVFEPDGTATSRYDKVRRVPFGEYVPLRPVFAPFSSLLPTRDQVPGTGPAVIDMGTHRFGVVISWEVFFPRRTREAVHHGAEILLNPTNGSSYTGTIVQSQQIASSQLRAVENDRVLLQAAPTGFSAVIGPDGTVRQRTNVSEQRVLYATVETREGGTIESKTGDLLPVAVSVALLAAGPLRRRWARRKA